METKPHWPRSDEPTATSTREELSAEKLVIDDCELVVIGGPHKGMSCALDKKSITIGRGPLCDLVLANDPTVSHRHCELSIEEEGIRLRDTQSSCGVFVDRIRIFDAYLKPDVIVRIGDTDLVLRQRKGQREIELRQCDASGRLLGTSHKMQALFLRIERLANSPLSVLLLGETGTGKSQVAEAIHEQSPRATHPFVSLNCSTLSPGLAESELFGHEEGAFTGASKRKRGVFEQANQGTLFLDELAELSLPLQAKLLDALERKTIKRVGGEEEIEVDFRLIAATNADLRALIDKHSFREDLYFRIAGDELFLPPLRERRGDIPLLARHFAEKYPGPQLELLPDAIRKLQGLYLARKCQGTPQRDEQKHRPLVIEHHPTSGCR